MAARVAKGVWASKQKGYLVEYIMICSLPLNKLRNCRSCYAICDILSLCDMLFSALSDIALQGLLVVRFTFIEPV
jgi:hypothetical protein